VLPAIFSYFTTYTSDAATIAFGLAETFNLIVIMLAFMAIVFQIPLFIMLAIMMNLVTRQWLEAKRLIFSGGRSSGSRSSSAPRPGPGCADYRDAHHDRAVRGNVGGAALDRELDPVAVVYKMIGSE